MSDTLQNCQRVRRYRDVALIVLFVGAISLPLLGMPVRVDVSTEGDENRTLASFPAVSLNASSLAAFPGQFKYYFNDNFAFRRTLIWWQANIKVNWLGVSSSPSVIIGKDGWLFFADEFSPEGQRRVPLFTKYQLERWRRVLEARRDWLAQRGIRYVFTVAPHKQTIYPEYLPKSLIELAKESRLRQLTDYLKQNSTVEFLDLRPMLLAAKSRHVLFPKTDSHWNYYAGLYVYQALVRHLATSFPGLRTVSESECEVNFIRGKGGDLARFLGLAGSSVEERPIVGLRKPTYVITKLRGFGPDGSIVDKPLMSAQGLQFRLAPNNVTFIASEQKDSKLPRAVMFHDSASVYLIPFLPQSFSRTVMSWTPVLDTNLINAEKPDVVVQEMGEMFLMVSPPPDVPEISSLMRKRSRDSSGEKLQPPDYAGFLDITNCSEVSGWAWDRKNADLYLDVEIYDGETLIAKVPADRYRQDLLDAAIGDGEHSFVFPLPASLKDGRAHAISARVAGSSFSLRNSPTSLKCAP